MRLILIAVLLLSAGAAQADVRGSVTFSNDEARIIAEWFEGNRYESYDSGKGKKPGKGKGKHKGLPPGIAMNLARGKALPPGIAKRSLPGSLIERLPPVPSGYERVIVDGRVLLVEIATRVIHDVLEDLILG